MSVPDSHLLLLADALVARLKTADFGSGNVFAEAQRRLVPAVALEELASTDDMTVYVTPAAFSTDLLTRGAGRLNERSMDVAFFQKLKGRTLTELETLAAPLVSLVDAAVDFMAEEGNRKLASHTLLRMEHDPIYHPSELREKQLFVSVVRVTYKAGG